MNERIRDLIKEADRRCNETRGVYDEILAELIISETVLKVYNHPQLYRDPNYSFETLLEDIKKEFGVEE